MKKFLIKVLALLVIVSCLFILLNFCYVKTNYWKYENDAHKFSSVPYEIELANLGSSHGNWGLYYDFLPEVKAFNFALGGQDYFYDYAMLRQYITHFKKNAVLLILVSYHMVIDAPNYEETEKHYHNFVRPRYYRILDKEYIDEWSFIDNLKYNQFPLFSAGIHVLDVIKDSSSSQNPYYARTKTMTESELKEYCDKWHNFHATERHSYSMNFAEVSRIIDFALESNLRPVLLTMPVVDFLSEDFKADKDFFSIFESFNNDLMKKYPGLRHIDYSRDSRFSSDHHLFADGDHLNMFGAEKVTKALYEDLKRMNFF